MKSRVSVEGHARRLKQSGSGNLSPLMGGAGVKSSGAGVESCTREKKLTEGALCKQELGSVAQGRASSA